MNKLKFKGRDIIDINDFSKEELLFILKTAKKFDPTFIKRDRSNYTIAQGKIAALLFFEPSTRTEQSFKSAAQKIGMGIIGFNDLTVTSTAKGESFSDTIRIMESYADVLIIRHPAAYSAKEAADLANIPVINAGDGPNQHPTQTMLDLYTMMKEAGKLSGITVAFMGDLKYGRTVHALSLALSLFKVKQIFISHKSLKMPDEFLEVLDKRGVVYEQLESLPDDLKADFLYQTRVQKERFSSLKEYKKIKDKFILDDSFKKYLDRGVRLMHPLPRVNEIDPALDSHPNAIYFKQARNGLYIREALLGLVLGRIT
ncbi:aspartate carbamoyltransferase [Candidatus Daviesbacteria bacterium RIFCSPLOWO2_01_FULL_39_12]|uniref:Aspartate carbamoyltransferase n=1 Tax=Candidatus Daviesbacteria bacterium RIFCSPLOWO2_01_FULL_39_12 TaxID=1797785 RepID=A0A1F5KQS2_9BACT|nr:MAG: aspartate carbamoyltransferase [Candidatus Daviesbacteria bacterium RIFCSPHIGHO2_02_FULL_39_8]OGE43155.1 MAG: aspartate carbamoyltransferase [Candidatus Daviesbacteria bacterium RIFCSPLOWO2_01_FULL_39_12]